MYILFINCFMNGQDFLKNINLLIKKFCHLWYVNYTHNALFDFSQQTQNLKVQYKTICLQNYFITFNIKSQLLSL